MTDPDPISAREPLSDSEPDTLPVLEQDAPASREQPDPAKDAAPPNTASRRLRDLMKSMRRNAEDAPANSEEARITLETLAELEAILRRRQSDKSNRNKAQP